MIFGKNFYIKIKMSNEWKQCTNSEMYKLFNFPDIIPSIKSKRIQQLNMFVEWRVIEMSKKLNCFMLNNLYQLEICH